MFELTLAEKQELVTNCDRLANLRHSSVNPLAFTEQGVAMLSSVLRSEKTEDEMDAIIPGNKALGVVKLHW